MNIPKDHNLHIHHKKNLNVPVSLHGFQTTKQNSMNASELLHHAYMS
jgi:hypothetical protein